MNNQYFTREHIEANRRQASAELAELAVYCLELVTELVESGLQFTFKGGNSQLLLLPEPYRLSIDVDVGTTETRERIIEVVEQVVAQSPAFTRWVHRPHKTKPWIPLTSFEIYYESVFKPGEETFVMLDAMLFPDPFPGTRRKVVSGDLYRSVAEVELPTIAGLIGDKFLTLGPATLGIPVGKNKEGQRLKHLFDCARLSEFERDIDSITESVAAHIAQEFEIQGRTLPTEEIITDTLNLLELPGKFPEEPVADGGDVLLGEVIRGREQLRGYLFSQTYSWEDMRNDAAAVAELVREVAAKL